METKIFWISAKSLAPYSKEQHSDKIWNFLYYLDERNSSATLIAGDGTYISEATINGDGTYPPDKLKNCGTHRTLLRQFLDFSKKNDLDLSWTLSGAGNVSRGIVRSWNSRGFNIETPYSFKETIRELLGI